MRMFSSTLKKKLIFKLMENMYEIEARKRKLRHVRNRDLSIVLNNHQGKISVESMKS